MSSVISTHPHKHCKLGRPLCEALLAWGLCGLGTPCSRGRCLSCSLKPNRPLSKGGAVEAGRSCGWHSPPSPITSQGWQQPLLAQWPLHSCSCLLGCTGVRCVWVWLWNGCGSVRLYEGSTGGGERGHICSITPQPITQKTYEPLATLIVLKPRPWA